MLGRLFPWISSPHTGRVATTPKSIGNSGSLAAKSLVPHSSLNSFNSRVTPASPTLMKPEGHPTGTIPRKPSAINPKVHVFLMRKIRVSLLLINPGVPKP